MLLSMIVVKNVNIIMIVFYYDFVFAYAFKVFYEV